MILSKVLNWAILLTPRRSRHQPPPSPAAVESRLTQATGWRLLGLANQSRNRSRLNHPAFELVFEQARELASRWAPRNGVIVC